MIVFSSLCSVIFLVVVTCQQYALDFVAMQPAGNKHAILMCLWLIGFGIHIPTSLVLFANRSWFFQMGIMDNFLCPKPCLSLTCALASGNLKIQKTLVTSHQQSEKTENVVVGLF